MNPLKSAGRDEALDRRQFLRGVGACLTLPLFESALRPVLRAAPAGGGRATTASGAPLRLAFVYFPNGARQDWWWPAGAGSEFELGRTMEPLAAVKNSLQVLGGLDHKNAAPGNDGAGDHARANATFLTGARARKTDGADIAVGVSADQIVAQQVGTATRFASLELTCDSIRKSGRCDSGYSCAYQYNLAWAGASTPMTPEANPRLVFERLFGAGGPGERRRNFAARQASQRSLLDAVREDARSLAGGLPPGDRQKLDEYLTGVREIERRVERAERFGEPPDPHTDAPAGIPDDFGEHMDLMYDLLAVAFETDSTRVATLLLAGDGSNRSFAQIGIPEGHHYCSHHRGNDELLGKVGAIDRFYAERFARFLQRLEKTRDLDGRSVLHNSMIVYGCGNADGNRHSHDNLPVILAGGGGGTLTPGRFTRLGGRPMTDLFLSLGDRMGVRGVERIGDSAARVSGV